MKKYNDISYGAHPLQKLDLYLPDCGEFFVLLYFHGGGLESGDKTAALTIGEYLTERGIAVVSANYRMYPQAVYPDFLTDAAGAAAWVFEKMGKYGGVKGVYLSGSSAGGYISQMLCFNPSFLAAVGLSPMSFRGFIHDAGQPTCHFNVLRERGIDSRRVIVDESAPLFHVGRAETYPRMLIIVSDHDMTNRYEQTVLLTATLQHFGHDPELKVVHGSHCAYINALDENAESVFGQIIFDFIKRGEKEL